MKITKEEIKLIEQLVKMSIKKGEIGTREDLMNALK